MNMLNMRPRPEGQTSASPLDQPFAVTFFKSFSADEKTAEHCTARALATRIRTVTAARKGRLPWLKLARFGDVRTDKRSLRHDANVLAITGIEADYDGGAIPFDEALERLQKQGIAAILYTSPSHTEAAPRWRVLCPLSGELPPERRAALLGRLNGLFGGVFSGESWTLSQSYYFGSVNGSAAHRVELIDGLPLDAHDDLDAIWAGKPNPTTSSKPNGEHTSGPIDEAALLKEITSGTSYHQATVRLLGRWACNGVPYMEARARLLAAFDAVFPPDRDARWQMRRDDVDRCLDDIYGKEAKHKDEGTGHEQPNGAGNGVGQGGANDAPLPGLAEFLSIAAWAERDIPQADRLLGDLITTTTRTFLVGRTGLGKTQLGIGMACGMANGIGFLHWRSARPGRVLYIDGEMPAELIKQRGINAMRRTGPIPAGNLVIFARDTEEVFASMFPTLGKMQPLNTEAGQNFIHRLIEDLGGVDVVIFDNVMSLIDGDQKDELPWSATLPLVSRLTAKRVGQVWLDHTGHNTDRQYGSSTKAWRFDSVGLLTPLPDDQRDHREMAFQLSFEHPGKARRRTPANWQDFETTIIRLREDRWTSETVASRGNADIGTVRPSRRPFYEALLSAIVKSTAGPDRTTLESWELECLRRGLIERPQEAKETSQQRDRRYSAFRKAKSDLIAAKWIAFLDEMVIDLKARRE